MAQIAAWVAGSIAAVFAVLMILQRSLYASAICLLVVLLQTGALIYLAGAPLLGFLQVMIYAGAVMVLVVMTILAAPTPVHERWAKMRIHPVFVVALLAGLTLEMGALVGAVSSGPAAGVPTAVSPLLGATLFGPYAVATEAVGLLLLFAGLALPIRRPGDPR